MQTINIDGTEVDLPKIVRLAAIDLGSNALRMAVVEVYSSDFFLPLKLSRKPLRLGESVFGTGKVSADKMKETGKYFKRFAEIIRKYNVDYHFAVATSALRDASNHQEVIDHVKKESGIAINLISGEAEAELIFKAVSHSVEFNNKRTLLIDIGGGSLELSAIKNNKLVDCISFKIGTVRTLKIMQEKKIDNAGLDKFIDEYRPDIKKFLKKSFGKDKVELAVGTGGNIERFAKLQSYFKRTLGAHDIDIESLNHIRKVLNNMTQEQRKTIFRLKNDRADVIIPAGAVLSMVMDEAGISEMNVPRVGLRDGVLYRMTENLKGMFP
jgi:exopolyphosphatase/guanosine-5'-triphosphate,3'-diphosphate pyrophosphatase